MSDQHAPNSDQVAIDGDVERDLDNERGSEVDDYTGEIPVVASVPSGDPDGGRATGFGDGDIADIDDPELDSAATTDTSDTTDIGDLSEVDIAAVLAERDQYRDVAMRLQADFENFRKRTATQMAADVDRATGRLAESFLPVLDAAEAAYVRHPDEIGPLLNLMLTELKKHGLATLDLEAQPFDPEVADAVAHEPGDGGDVIVAEVLRSGYRWRDKTLRPAMVRTKD